MHEANPTADAELGDLLAFEPVVRRHRVDGWTAESQRAFIAALAMTGSPRRAAKAIGKNAYNAGQLRLAEGAEGFSAAWDRAMRIAQQRQSERLGSQVSELARRSAPSAHPQLRQDEPWPDDAEMSAADHEALSLDLFRKYLIKLRQERRARLAGKVVEADFYLRQISFFEVMIDLAQEARGVPLWPWISSLRRGDHGLMSIARTPFSRFLDEARRAVWAEEAGEPQRPPPPAEEYFEDHDGYSVEPLEFIWGGPEADTQRQQEDFEERHRREAAAQVEWEARSTEAKPNDGAADASI